MLACRYAAAMAGSAEIARRNASAAKVLEPSWNAWSPSRYAATASRLSERGGGSAVTTVGPALGAATVLDAGVGTMGGGRVPGSSNRQATTPAPTSAASARSDQGVPGR